MEIFEIIDKRFMQLDKLLNDYINQKKYAGLITLIYQRGIIKHCQRLGYKNLEKNEKTNFNQLFRIASMTKPVISVAVLILMEEGKISLNDPMSKFIPEASKLKVFKEKKNGEIITEGMKSEITILDLLTHTSGFIYPDEPDHPVDKLYIEAFGEYNEKLYQMNSEEFIKKLFGIPLKQQPGKYAYSYSTDVLGCIIEIITKQPLNDFLKNEIFQKLEMKDIGFYIENENVNRLGTVYIKDESGSLIKANEYRQNQGREKIKFFSGGGGLISTLSDYLNFCIMLLNKGKFGSTQLLRAKTVEMMLKDYTTPRKIHSFNEKQILANPMSDDYKKSLIAYRKGTEFALGGQITIEEHIIPKGVFGWIGSLTTLFWIDPRNELIGIFLTQYDGLFDYPIFAEIMNSVYSAIK